MGLVDVKMYIVFKQVYEFDFLSKWRASIFLIIKKYIIVGIIYYIGICYVFL